MSDDMRLREIIDGMCDPRPDSAFDEGINEYRRRAGAAVQANGWLSPDERSKLERRVRELEERVKVTDKFVAYSEAFANDVRNLLVPLVPYADMEPGDQRLQHAERTIVELGRWAKDGLKKMSEAGV